MVKKVTPIRLLVLGSSEIRDERIVKAAVRTAGWFESIQHIQLPANPPFSDAVARWAKKHGIAVHLYEVDTTRYHSRNAALIASRDKAAAQSTKALLIFDHTAQDVALFVTLVNRFNLKRFEYYTVC